MHTLAPLIRALPPRRRERCCWPSADLMVVAGRGVKQLLCICQGCPRTPMSGTSATPSALLAPTCLVLIEALAEASDSWCRRLVQEGAAEAVLYKRASTRSVLQWPAHAQNGTGRRDHSQTGTASCSKRVAPGPTKRTKQFEQKGRGKSTVCKTGAAAAKLNTGGGTKRSNCLQAWASPVVLRQRHHAPAAQAAAGAAATAGPPPCCCGCAPACCAALRLL